MSVQNNENLTNLEENNIANYDPSYEIETWDDLDLSNELLRGIYAKGFENPSPIQKKAIKPMKDGRDIIAQAQSGKGKTATFIIGSLANVNTTKNTSQILALSPTRELATQTTDIFKEIGQMIKGLRIQSLFAGSSVDEMSVFSDKKTPHIICGCPGRVFDMIRRGKLNAKDLKVVILDEADEMLSSCFKDQVYNIFQHFNNNIQVALFSATLPDNIHQIINKIMRNPVKICVKPEDLTLDGIRQFVIAIEDDRQKYQTLKDLFSYISVSQCIIYCNSVKRVVDLYEAMKEDDFPVCCIHSNMDKSARDAAFHNFKYGTYRVLISSNVTARGIDIQQVSVVINFDLPKCVHTYLHRIGRSGRWGRKGVGINFITRRDITKIKEIEQHYSCNIEEMPANLTFLQSV
jgi:translation initiation factor 4A